MTRFNLKKGLILSAACAALGFAPLAQAGQRDRDYGHHDGHHDDRRDRDGFQIDFRIGTSRDRFERPERCEPARVERVWVEPVYRTVCDRVWVEPVYRTVCDRVWREPVYEDRCDRVWIQPVFEFRDVTYYDHGHRRTRCERVEVQCGRWEEQHHQVLVCDGRWEKIERQELVCAGRWDNVERQELVCAGHWDNRKTRQARGDYYDRGWRYGG